MVVAIIIKASLPVSMGGPYLSVRNGRWLLMLPLAERWGSPSSPSLVSHLGVGVIWLPRPSAVLVAFSARDLAPPFHHLSPALSEVLRVAVERECCTVAALLPSNLLLH